MTAVPIDRPRRGSKSTDLPEIKPWSWLGLESIAWGFVIAHLVKWAVSFGYFTSFQVRYAVGYGKGTWTVWYLKDWWDELPLRAQNALDRLGWQVQWFPDGQSPIWWITWRHDIRDVTISVVATIIVRLLFAKPKYPADDRPGLKVYLTRVPLALLAALVPIAAVGVLAWKVPWLLQHGYKVPENWGVLASEANGWIAAGTWITVLMGILGGLVATKVMQRIADDIQWFFAERSAAKIQAESKLSLTGSHVIGTPAHRARVHWLLEHETDLPARSPWLVRILLVVGFLSLAAAGAGAWLNLWGPAAPH